MLWAAASQLQTQTGQLDQVMLFCFLSLNTPLKLILSGHTKHQVQPTENDLYSTFCVLFSIPKAPTADTIVTPTSEQIIEMHQWRRGVGVKN